MTDYKLQSAELLIRVFTGILFFIQGYDKLFRIKLPGVVSTFREDAERSHIPVPLVSLVAYYTSIAELLGGTLLLLRFCTTFALYALGLDLLLVCLAFTYMNPMWDMKFVFPRLLLVTALLLVPNSLALFRLDHLLHLP